MSFFEKCYGKKYNVSMFTFNKFIHENKDHKDKIIITSVYVINCLNLFIVNIQ